MYRMLSKYTHTHTHQRTETHSYGLSTETDEKNEIVHYELENEWLNRFVYITGVNVRGETEEIRGKNTSGDILRLLTRAASVSRFTESGMEYIVEATLFINTTTNYNNSHTKHIVLTDFDLLRLFGIHIANKSVRKNCLNIGNNNSRSSFES